MFYYVCEICAFWDFAYLRMVLSYRCFGTTYRVLSLRVKQSSCIAWPLKTGLTRCFETLVLNYQSTLRKISKERRSHLRRRWSLKSRIVFACVISFSRLLRACCMLCPNHPLWCVYPNLMKCTNYDTTGYIHKFVKIHYSNLYHIPWIVRPASSSLFNRALILTVRHRASRILGQVFHYSPENAFYIFNQQIYFIWYLLDRASLI